MAEWSIAAVLKTVVLRGTGGSNPSLSARRKERETSSLLECFSFLFIYNDIAAFLKVCVKSR